jgi:hypothetical protein
VSFLVLLLIVDGTTKTDHNCNCVWIQKERKGNSKTTTTNNNKRVIPQKKKEAKNRKQENNKLSLRYFIVSKKKEKERLISLSSSSGGRKDWTHCLLEDRQTSSCGVSFFVSISPTPDSVALPFFLPSLQPKHPCLSRPCVL